LIPDGATVRQGDLIGLVGNTGCSTGAHLHMEVWHDGVRLYDWDDAAPGTIRVGDPIPFSFPGLAPEDPVGWDGCTGGERDACAAIDQNWLSHQCVRKPTTYDVLSGDFDGDRKTDLLTVSPNAGGGWREWAALELARDGGFASEVWGAGSTIHMTNGGVDARYRTLAADFDGDGKTDLATVSPNAGGGWVDWIALELSTGSAFRSEVWPAGTPIHMRNGGPESNYVTLAGDFDGDRKTDIATLSPNAGGAWAEWVALELSTGSGFRSEVWGVGTPIHMRNGDSSRWYHVLPGDFDGDGKTDIATLSAAAGGGWAEWVALELSTGTGFRSEVWPAGTAIHMRNGGASDYDIRATDVNADGKADLVTFTQTGGGGWAEWYAVELSNGHGFDSQVWPSPTPQHARNGGAADYRMVVGDFDANRRGDVAMLSPNAGGAWAGWLTLDLSNGTGFESRTHDIGTPIHMRNGIR
jgi:hypothetical protein